ncbi:MAG: bifunctional oligoribonuclease/PAP phosphatase NrnA [Phycisphaerae bacterium]|nr:bifunctional oligoribonuclease/PAP phosphatase NrnA [Phycisphaerae bacterium]MDD5381425.1 bifunctional oligoribonuclease/PAP phosphatase NrnA [Phycisphaerae bacterium]
MIDNSDFQKAVELINKSKRVLLTTHTRPDGDGCGCIATIAETLTALGKNVKILLLSELPAWYDFLFEQKPETFSKETKMDSDLTIIVDTAAHNQLPGLDKYLKQSDKLILAIDHHVTNDGLGAVKLIDSSAAAAALIVFDLLKYAGWPITKKIAEALFVSVSTDTGWFQFDNTDSRAMKVCAELIDAGANPSRIYRNLYQHSSPQRFRLMVAMFNTLELHLDERFVMQHLSQADFKRTGAKLSDTENLIDECRRISSVEAAALFVEQADGQVKVSLRSRGAVDVCKIAAKFGGGGHKMAAGAHLPGPIENAKKLIFDAAAEQFK